MTALWYVGIVLTIVGLFAGSISIAVMIGDGYITPIAISIVVLIIGILLVNFNGGFSLLFPII